MENLGQERLPEYAVLIKTTYVNVQSLNFQP